MINAERHALLMTTRTTGWGVLLKVLDDLVREAEQLAFAQEDPTRLTCMAHQARGAHELVRKFKLRAEEAQQPSETGSSD